ncbi:prolyl-tRNA synthetase associated domain-containing protein [Brucella abortus]|uniref:prolyl-tRNA synthetase associated domain-containing protein n=1 Tax=Brucella abortus TaxID=235 RepID=UPI0001B4929D|nr:prolyl-tRNA synthetase associated domain-containing protein [Brucella abortus]EEX84805.1 YbaK/prolyl-tRNA synthetase [Brucella abortus bv. 3 str. Tulya]
MKTSGGIMPLTPKEFHDLLHKLGIGVTTVEHPPLFTVADSQNLRGEIPGGHTKNLFLKDKKDNFFLVTVEEDAVVDLKSIHQLIGAASRVSFGKPEKLMEYLGVIPGSVTVFGAANDTNHRVQVILDAGLMKYDIINGHPLTNEATTSIRREDLIAFLKSTGHEPRILAVSEGAKLAATV